jgi:hypothetical protein
MLQNDAGKHNASGILQCKQFRILAAAKQKQNSLQE